jgi:hypothetical protein
LIDNYSYDKLIINDLGRINYVKDGLKFLKLDEDNTSYNVLFYITTVKKGKLFSKTENGQYYLAFESDESLKNFHIKRDSVERNWISLNLTYFQNNKAFLY